VLTLLAAYDQNRSIVIQSVDDRDSEEVIVDWLSHLYLGLAPTGRTINFARQWHRHFRFGLG
jgi:hypothetical protein